MCVSWLDDLVWHATPSLNERIVYSATLAKAHYEWANSAADIMHAVTTQKGGLDYYHDHHSFYYFYYDAGNNEKWIHLVELLGTIADDSSTALVAWLTTQGKRAQDIDCDVAGQAWAAVYAGADGRARFAKDADLRGRAEWRMTGQLAVANAFEKRLKDDPQLADSPKIVEPPVGVSTIRRANSAGSTEFKAKLTEVAAANKDVPRSFIRTWVRILPKNSDELQKAGFVVH
jgi:hypothetical protein